MFYITPTNVVRITQVVASLFSQVIKTETSYRAHFSHSSLVGAFRTLLAHTNLPDLAETCVPRSTFSSYYNCYYYYNIYIWGNDASPECMPRPYVQYSVISPSV